MAERNTVTTNKRKPKSSGGTPRRGDRSKLARKKTAKDLTEKEDPPVDLEPDGARGTVSTYANRYEALDDSDDENELDDAISNEDKAENPDDDDDDIEEEEVGLISMDSGRPATNHSNLPRSLKSSLKHNDPTTALTVYDSDDAPLDPDPAFTPVPTRSRRDPCSPPTHDKPASPPKNRRSNRDLSSASQILKKTNKNTQKIALSTPSSDKDDPSTSSDEDFIPLATTEFAQDLNIHGTVNKDEITQLLEDQQTDLDALTASLRNPPLNDDSSNASIPTRTVFAPRVFSPDTPSPNPKPAGTTKLNITPMDIDKTLLSTPSPAKPTYLQTAQERDNNGVMFLDPHLDPTRSMRFGLRIKVPHQLHNKLLEHLFSSIKIILREVQSATNTSVYIHRSLGSPL